jgi:hypothetical protein
VPDPFQRPRQAEDRVPFERNGGVAGGTAGGQRHHVRDLLRGLNRQVALAAGDDTRSPALVDRELGVEQIAVILDQPLYARFAACFLVGCGDKDDVALERHAGGNDASLNEEHCHDVRREHSFVVYRPAAVQVSIADDSAKRIARPLVRFHADDVHVGEHHHRAGVPVPPDPRHDRGAIPGGNE